MSDPFFTKGFPSRPHPVQIPTKPYQAPAGLTGDIRVLTPRQTATLVDADWSVPRVLLVTAEASGGAAPMFRLKSGIERGVFGTDEVQIGSFARVVIARSVQLLCENVTGVNTTVKAVVTEIDATVNVGDILGTDPLSPTGDPNRISDNYAVAANVASVALDNFPNPALSALWKGISIYNHSPAGRNLFVRLSDLGSAATTLSGGFSFRIQPGGYWESPFRARGTTQPTPGIRITGIWDGADAAGGAQVAVYSYDPSFQ